MSLPLTPHILEASYEYLRATPPFRSWRLPKGREVKFHVLRTKQFEGDHTTYLREGGHIIRVSSGKIGHTGSLMAVMAHEMIHAYQARRKTETANTVHNAEFHRLAARVCKLHGFDLKLFV